MTLFLFIYINKCFQLTVHLCITPLEFQINTFVQGNVLKQTY